MTSGRTLRIQEGERNSRRDVRPETDGREETGGTGSVALGFVDVEKAFDTGHTQRDFDGDATVDVRTRSGSEGG